MSTNQLSAGAARGVSAFARTGGLLVVAAMASGPVGPASAEQRAGFSSQGDLRSEKFRTSEHPFVEVDNLYGAVEVLAGAENEVLVEARVHGSREGAADSFRVEIAPSAAGVQARASCAGAGVRFAWCGKQRVDFVLHVPANASLDLRGVGTDLRVVGVRGELLLSTVSGSIDVRDAGVVRAESASGSVRVERASAAEISAGDGNVELVGMRKGTAIYRRARDGEFSSGDIASEEQSASGGEEGEEGEKRSLVIRGAESILRRLLGAFHRSTGRTCGSGEAC